MIIFTGEKAINFDQVKTINIVKDDDKYAVIAEPGGTIIKFDVKPDAVDFLKYMIEKMSDEFNENVIDTSLYNFVNELLHEHEVDKNEAKRVSS